MPLNDYFLFNIRNFSDNDRGTSQAGSASTGSIGTVPAPQDSSSILAGLNAFTPEDREREQTTTKDFAEQLELWTNANFSFDGPTGHALLLDDEKDAEAKREESERQDKEREKESNNTNRADVKAGKSRAGSRPSTVRDIEGGDDASSVPPSPHEAALLREHKLAGDKLHYFAPPSTAAGESRRSAYPTDPRDPKHRRHAENSMPNGTSDQPVERPLQPVITGENAFSQFSMPHQPLTENSQQQANAGAPLAAVSGMPFAVSPELMQAIAFQQILSGANPYVNNPFNLLAQAQGAFGGFAGQGFPTAAIPGVTTGFGSGGVDVPTFTMPTWTQPSAGGGSVSHQGDSAHDVDKIKENSKANAKDTTESSTRASSVSASSSSRKRRHSSKEDREREREEEEEHARALRDEIPPLKLIDTGNPEADAEANRAAIEEDKRRRNTAASARFRVKKKQREQALEQSAKILEDKVKALEDENARLHTENGWLKSLITIRPGTMTPTIQHPLPTTMPGSNLQPGRDTGLHPRGVGTALEHHHHQQQQSVSGGDRSRED